MQIRQYPLWLLNPEDTSPEIQNRGISGHKMGHVYASAKKIKKEKRKKKGEVEWNLLYVSNDLMWQLNKHLMVAWTVNEYLFHAYTIEGKKDVIFFLFCFLNDVMLFLFPGDPELDVTSDAYDVLLANPDGGDFDSDEG